VITYQRWLENESNLLGGAVGPCWEWKHFFNGNQLAQMLNVKRGPIIADLLQKQEEWQWLNPESIDQPKCLQYIRNFLQKNGKNYDN